jgi:hypothetical protein
MRIGELLDLLKTVMALLALVLVKWHGIPEIRTIASSLVIPSGS